MTLPTHFHQIKNQITKRTEDTIKGATARINGEQERQRKELDVLAEATLEYLTTGIADLVKWGNQHINVQVHGIGWGGRGFEWHQYFRRIADEKKRPYVRILPTWTGEASYSARMVLLPKRRYLDPVIASFTLLPEAECKVQGNKTHWTFWFGTRNAPEIIDEWRQRCSTDPDLRRALRVT